MKMKFKDLYIGQEFTHELLEYTMMKVENESYSINGSYAPVLKDRIEPNTALAETWVVAN